MSALSPSDNQKIDAFITQVEKNKLPALDISLQEIKRHLGLEKTNYETLNKIIQRDPMCLVNFLSCANRYKDKLIPDGDELIKKPKHACMLLGIDNIDRCISGQKPLSSNGDKKIAAKIEQLAFRSLHCAYQARHLAVLLNHKNEEEVFFTALLCSLAELLIWSVDIRQAQQYELLIYVEQKQAEEAQLEIFGFHFKDLLIELSSRWHFSELLVEILNNDILVDAKKDIICIKLADKLSRLVDFGWYYQEFYDFLEFAEMVTPFDVQRLAREFHQCAIAMGAEVSQIYTKPLPLIYLAYNAGNVAYFPVIELKEEKAEVPKKTVEKKIHNNYELEKQVKSHKINLESAGNIPTLIQLTISLLLQEEEIDHVILAILDKPQINLVVRVEKGEPLKGLSNYKLNIKDDKNLFSQMLAKPQTIFINEILKQKAAALFTDEVNHLLPSESCSMTSIFHKNKPIGVFLVSRNQGMNKDDFDKFRQKMVRFNQHLTKVG